MKNFDDGNGAYGFESTKINIRKMILARTNKMGQAKIYVEVTEHKYKGEYEYDTNFRRISTNVWILPKNWNKRKQEIKPAEEDAEFKNKKVNKIYHTVQKYVDSKGMQTPDQVYGEQLNLESLREFFPKKNENKKCLTDYIEDYYELRKRNGTPYGTYKEFKSLKNRIVRFDEFRGRKTYFSDINLTWSDDYEFFAKKEHGDGTIEKTYTILVTVLNHYYDRKDELQIELSDKFRARGFKRGQKSVNDPVPLTPEQLETLKKHKFEKVHLEKTKKRFLLQCYTGLRYSDLFRVQPELIKNGWLVVKPKKTERYNKTIEQPLNDVAKNLMKEFDYDLTKLKIENQPYNRQLKDIFEIMQEKYPKLKFKNYTSHNGRDTFITMCVEKGIDWKSILKFVGQSSYKIMDRYMSPNPQYQEEQARKLNS